MKSYVTTIADMLEPSIQYVIPQFQREYAWQRNQWLPLWDDIQNVAQNIANAPNAESVPPHFMGPIVMQQRKDQSEDRDSYIIVDGQQRLTTIAIVLRAFANASQECGLLDMEDKFLSYVQNYNGPEYSPKVRHLHRGNYNDLKAVLEMYSGGTDMNSRMSRCHDFFQSRAVTYIRQGEDRERSCQNLLDVLRHKLETAVLTLEPNEQPNKVFETLNARGAPLKQSELIKNTIMYEGNVIEDEEQANILWGTREQEMDHPYYGRENREGERLDKFFADWLTAINRNRVASDHASTEFRHYLTSVKNSGQNIGYITQRMKQSAEIYRKVQTNDFPHSRPSTTRLLAAGTEFFMPVVLWLWSEDKEIELSQRQSILRIIESYVVRRILTGNSVGDSIAGNITGMLNAMQANLNTGRDPQEGAYSWISMNQNEAIRWPSDNEVIDKIANYPHEMSASRRNMVLNAIESRLRIDNGQQPVGSGFQSATLIPEGEIGRTHYPIEGRPTPARLERRNGILKQLGNFTLTQTNLSRREREAPWEEKREALERRGGNALMTQRLLRSQQQSFTEQDIVDRSRWMAELCVVIWPREQE